MAFNEGYFSPGYGSTPYNMVEPGDDGYVYGDSMSVPKTLIEAGVVTPQTAGLNLPRSNSFMKYLSNLFGTTAKQTSNRVAKNRGNIAKNFQNRVNNTTAINKARSGKNTIPNTIKETAGKTNLKILRDAEGKLIRKMPKITKADKIAQSAKTKARVGTATGLGAGTHLVTSVNDLNEDKPNIASVNPNTVNNIIPVDPYATTYGGEVVPGDYAKQRNYSNDIPEAGDLTDADIAKVEAMDKPTKKVYTKKTAPKKTTPKKRTRSNKGLGEMSGFDAFIAANNKKPTRRKKNRLDILNTGNVSNYNDDGYGDSY